MIQESNSRLRGSTDYRLVLRYISTNLKILCDEKNTIPTKSHRYIHSIPSKTRQPTFHFTSKKTCFFFCFQIGQNLTTRRGKKISNYKFLVIREYVRCVMLHDSFNGQPSRSSRLITSSSTSRSCSQLVLENLFVIGSG